MENNNYKLDSLTDKLLENNHGEEVDSDLVSIIKSIKVSKEVSVIGEEMKDSILAEVNSRINISLHRKLWFRASLVAASVLLLFGMTNYFFYTKGYNQVNSQLVELKNPLGMQTSIILSDGTNVILNSGTVLSYPTAFTSKYREVSVRGEAYFDVAKDVDHPFIVNAENINVRVLGTKFNVKAYEEENSIDVTLEEGRVEVGLTNFPDSYKIEPGQRICFDKSKSMFTQSKINTKHLTSWKDGEFYFDKNSFEEIARQLERRFNVNIEIVSDNLKHIVYSGDFIRNENLEQILTVMTADRRSKYIIDGNQVRIYE